MCFSRTASRRQRPVAVSDDEEKVRTERARAIGSELAQISAHRRRGPW
ncbi:hypothetical protein I553_1041 [Mycobacterium xenopi 4042]|uniref:Uncharacterized protein n=1 Tax=Mycobacterium xenopi 4042 TaxID=1299334 RepID=X7ZAM6_MYCXE|nr:hypothetical protein I553_1041 [Mycobacterium xenopi 4042]